MLALFDINVLLARFDSKHVHHPRVTGWLASRRIDGLITCPLTENGFLRIFSNPSYPSGPGSLPDALVLMERIRSLPGHQFLPDAFSLMDHQRFNGLGNATSSQLTDLYLLALAVHHSVKFVTLDGRVPAHIVHGGKAALVVIP